MIAAGAWSGELTKQIGLRVPLESERGYHLQFHGAENRTKEPIMITTGKFVATPMTEGVRCAGIVEFGGLHAGPSPAAFKFLKTQVLNAFPKLQGCSAHEWFGHRPTTADFLPLIGEVRSSSVYCAFGHHHYGLTAGPKTGRIIADLISGRPADSQLRYFDPNRFS